MNKFKSKFSLRKDKIGTLRIFIFTNKNDQLKHESYEYNYKL